MLDRLGLQEVFDHFVPTTDPREKVPFAFTLGVLLRNMAVANKDALYAQADWADRCVPALLGLTSEQMAAMGDDRIGRALDRLYQADRAALQTEVVLRAVRNFQVVLEELHNDSTSITFSGNYRNATGRPLWGRRAVHIANGFNKDHRPDLKQMLWVLTVSADGAVPVHYRVWDGNTADDRTHLDTWHTLTKVVGGPDFLYVADCKLCNRATMRVIDTNGGRFLTVLPRNRAEDAWFRNWLQDHEPAWQEVSRSKPCGGSDGPEDVWRVFEAPVPSAEGYRIVWVWNSSKAVQDADFRQRGIQKASASLESLAHRLAGPRSRLRTREAVEKAVADAVGQSATRWIKTQAQEVPQESSRKEGPGRPSPNSRYVRETRMRWCLSWMVDVDKVKADARSDGMFPLITNDRGLDPGDALGKYKYQPFLEKRHQQLKTVHHVTPVCLKNEGRIEALLLLHFMGLLIHSLLERALRQAMVKADVGQLPLSPEERSCHAPTADRVLSLFADVQFHYLYQKGILLKVFGPQLTELQGQVLDLLEISSNQFVPTWSR